LEIKSFFTDINVFSILLFFCLISLYMVVDFAAIAKLIIISIINFFIS